jgi:hypothetical protein
MTNIDSKFSLIFYLTLTLTIGKFNDKKGIFYLFYWQTSYLLLNF